MVGQHHPLNRHEFEQTLGDSEGQGSLACCEHWRSIAHLMGQRLSLLDSVNSVSFLSLRNVLPTRAFSFCIMLQSWKEVGCVHQAGVERHLRREKPGAKEHVRQADGRRGKILRHCVSYSH